MRIEDDGLRQPPHSGIAIDWQRYDPIVVTTFSLVPGGPFA